MKIEDFNNKMENYKIQLEKGENIDKELFKKDVYDMMKLYGSSSEYLH